MAGWLDFLLGRTETRRAGSLAEPWYPMTVPGGLAAAVAPVTPHTAESHAAVVACVGAIAGSIATLPAFVFTRTDDGGRQEAPTHPLTRLIRLGPNARQTWAEYLEYAVSQVLLYGNHLAAVTWSGTGAIAALDPIPWQHVQPVLLSDGRLVFDVNAGNGPRRRILAEDALVIKGRSDDGILGRSVLSRAGNVVQNALDADMHASSVFQNVAASKGVIELPKGIDPTEARRMEAFFTARNIGPEQAGRPLFVPAGVEYTAVSVSPADAQLLDSRKYSVLEICRLFNVSPQIIHDLSASSFNNSETAIKMFAQGCLQPHIAKLESAFSKYVFQDARYELSIDMSGLVRGSYVERAQANVAFVNAGILTPNEVREQDLWPPLAGGDALRIAAAPAAPA